jgi:hypothetical protein
VANADPKQMVHSIDHMPKKTANQIIAAAKVSNFYRPVQPSFLNFHYFNVFADAVKTKYKFMFCY